MTSRKSEASALLTTQAARLYKIERALRRGRTVPFATLRNAIEVSPATLKRDLQLLRDEFGAPIQYDVVENGYRLVGAWPGIPAMLFEQLEAV